MYVLRKRHRSRWAYIDEYTDEGKFVTTYKQYNKLRVRYIHEDLTVTNLMLMADMGKNDDILYAFSVDGEPKKCDTEFVQKLIKEGIIPDNCV